MPGHTIQVVGIYGNLYVIIQFFAANELMQTHSFLHTLFSHKHHWRGLWFVHSHKVYSTWITLIAVVCPCAMGDKPLLLLSKESVVLWFQRQFFSSGKVHLHQLAFSGENKVLTKRDWLLYVRFVTNVRYASYLSVISNTLQSYQPNCV